MIGSTLLRTLTSLLIYSSFSFVTVVIVTYRCCFVFVNRADFSDFFSDSSTFSVRTENCSENLTYGIRGCIILFFVPILIPFLK